MAVPRTEVLPHVLREMPVERLERVRRRPAQPADGGELQGAVEFLDLALLAVTRAAAEVGADLEQPLGPDAARDALAAGLAGEELGGVDGLVDDATRVVIDD